MLLTSRQWLCIPLTIAENIVSKVESRPRTIGIALSCVLHLCLGLSLIEWTKYGVSGAGNEGNVWGSADGIVLVAVPVSVLTAPMPLQTVEPSAEMQDVVSFDSRPNHAFTESNYLPSMPTIGSSSADLADTETQTSQSETGGAMDGGSGAGGTTSGKNSDLWAAIEPCWRRRASADTLPVVLNVSFDSEGRLAAVPIIVRGDGDFGLQFQRSEAQALQALADCATYRVAAGQINVLITFPRVGN